MCGTRTGASSVPVDSWTSVYLSVPLALSSSTALLPRLAESLTTSTETMNTSALILFVVRFFADKVCSDTKKKTEKDDWEAPIGLAKAIELSNKGLNLLALQFPAVFAACCQLR